jgi:hypothetical protein
VVAMGAAWQPISASPARIKAPNCFTRMDVSLC